MRARLSKEEEMVAGSLRGKYQSAAVMPEATALGPSGGDLKDIQA